MNLVVRKKKEYQIEVGQDKTRRDKDTNNGGRGAPQATRAT